MSSFRERNDRKQTSDNKSERPASGRRDKPFSPPRQKAPDDGSEWLWGWHAVNAALSNPLREKPMRVMATEERARQLTEAFGKIETLGVFENSTIAQHLPQHAVHQGVALKVLPLESMSLEDLAEPAHGVILMLDQVTDPQNVGAVFRSAAAFGARGVIVQDRHAPALGGALAKARRVKGRGVHELVLHHGGAGAEKRCEGAGHGAFAGGAAAGGFCSLLCA